MLKSTHGEEPGYEATWPNNWRRFPSGMLSRQSHQYCLFVEVCACVLTCDLAVAPVSCVKSS